MSPDPVVPDHHEWSAAQSSTELRVDGHDLTVAYRDRGSGAGTPTVFLHGIPTWSFLWRRISPRLEADRRTVVPDLLGYGNSDRRDSFDRSIRAQEQMLQELIDELGIGVVTLVAHDIGGGVALRYAAHHPDRVESLVLSNAVCYDSWPVEFVSDLGLPSTAGRDPAELHETLDPAFRAGLVTDDPDESFVEGIQEPWLRENGPLALARAATAVNTNHTTEIAYDRIDSRVLCLWGDDDVMQPVSYGERLAADLDGELERLSPAYHWVVEDQPEDYSAALASFL
jgi:pimeloyl-ACP methyl ester carboxylesterase